MRLLDMNNITTILGNIAKGLLGLLIGASIAAAGFVITALIAPLIGAFAGAVFGFFFNDTADALVAALGMPVQFWQLGALGGFFASFLKRR